MGIQNCAQARKSPMRDYIYKTTGKAAMRPAATRAKPTVGLEPVLPESSVSLGEAGPVEVTVVAGIVSVVVMPEEVSVVVVAGKVCVVVITPLVLLVLLLLCVLLAASEELLGVTSA